jgi:hypothetical protein
MEYLSIYLENRHHNQVNPVNASQVFNALEMTNSTKSSQFLTAE